MHVYFGRMFANYKYYSAIFGKSQQDVLIY